MKRYPDISGPPRSYLAPILIVLAIGGAVYAGYWWYLQGLESDCRHRCLTKGHKDYRYVEPTGFSRRVRPGSCTCIQ